MVAFEPLKDLACGEVTRESTIRTNYRDSLERALVMETVDESLEVS